MIRIGTPMPEVTRRLIEQEARRYARLGEDLRRLAANTAPTPGELEEAPALTAWRISYYDAPILLGRVHGHPILTGARISTSELVVIDSMRGFARTRSRWYVLGDSAADAVPGAAND